MKIFVYFLAFFFVSLGCVMADDTGSIEYLNRWPTAAPNVITRIGDYVFMGDGEVIAVYDAAGLGTVARVSIRLSHQEELDNREAAGTEGVSGLFYADGYLYVACGNEGLQIYEIPADISTFSSNNLKSTYVVEKGDARAVVRDVAVAGKYAYIGYYWLSNEGYDSGIRAIDVTDPAGPVLAGETQLPQTFAELKRVQAVTLAGGYIYVADLYNGLVIYDLTNPGTPQVEAVCYVPSALDVSVSGHYAYLVCAGYGLLVVDVNPEYFTADKDILSSLAFSQYNLDWTKAASVETDDNYAYVGDIDLGLQIIDISSPAEIGNDSVVGSLTFNSQGAYRLYYDSVSKAVYLGDCRQGLQKLDVSDPTAPEVLAAVNDTNTPADTDEIFVDTQTSYVFTVDDDATVGNMKEGVRILFAILSEDYVSFLLKGMLPTDGEASDLYLYNGDLYVADGSDGLKIIDPGLPEDTAGPVNPVLKGGCAIAGGNANGVFVLDGYAYVAAGTGGLKVVDVSDPSSPVVVGGLAGEDLSDSQKVTVKADYAFVADGANGLKIVDITDKQAPFLTGQYYIDDSDDLNDIPGYAFDVNVVGTLAYVAAGDEGFYVIVVSDPYNPEYLSDFSANPYEQVKGIFAARSDQSEGVDLIWVANGTAPDDNMGFFLNPSTVPPQRSVAYHSAGDVKDVFVVGDYAYIADSSGGFQALTVLEGSNDDNGSGDNNDPDWDDDVVPIDIHNDDHNSSGCFVGTLIPDLAEGVLRWFAAIRR